MYVYFISNFLLKLLFFFIKRAFCKNTYYTFLNLFFLSSHPSMQIHSPGCPVHFQESNSYCTVWPLGLCPTSQKQFQKLNNINQLTSAVDREENCIDNYVFGQLYPASLFFLVHIQYSTSIYDVLRVPRFIACCKKGTLLFNVYGFTTQHPA